MEPVMLIPFILVMSGVAVVTALKGHPVPVSASPSFVAATEGQRPKKPMTTATVAGLTEDASATEPAAGAPRPQFEPDGSESNMDEPFSKTDVLLADALTEMIGLKAELYYLRGKIDSLNAEVARLSGTHLRPVPPNASSKKPVPLRKAA